MHIKPQYCTYMYGTVQLQLYTCFASRMVCTCFSVDRGIITCVPTNSHACKTCVIPTQAVFMHAPYIF